ncbi:nascent polypeptide-associated complex subunit alpha [Acaromyces ingoldii]|uniref:Nascent polypeptide-associated complex subunit alpha n=1 Tax=Acaromyces ingoldii TaxID=215250 RepID=A0A316YNI5_9BASI|nr:nascent polypeptide-associated complex subunit alpha [Acaromyces ingoldii]PWN90937.1 nascent polypeptide-associated complex subunit alpha [Acaromyces ingoldii]
MSATVEEITDDVQDLNVQEEEAESGAAGLGGDVTVGEQVSNKAERKARKSLQNIGLKKVQGITRVTMRRPRGHLYVVSSPEVYKSSVSDCYIVFGEAKNEDMSAQAQAAQAQQMAQAEQQERLLSEQFSQMQQQGQDGGAADKKKEEEEDEDDGSPIDESGVDAKDIDLVMAQVSVSRRKAVKALKESNGDLINAIMACS